MINLSDTEQQNQGNPPLNPEIRMLTVGLHKVRVHIAGKSMIASGMPTVVFENGLGMSIEEWDPLLNRVAQFAPVVAYDRPGIGQSVSGEFKPDPSNVAALLRNILEQIGFAPPFVLVGFSMGGLYVRMFAATYPEDVTGVVYIDPVDFTETTEISHQVFSEVGCGPEARSEYIDVLNNFIRESSDEQTVAEWEQAKILRDDGYAAFNRRVPPATIPQVILASSKEEQPLGKYTFDFARWAKHSKERSTERLLAWTQSLTEGHFVATAASPHMIHADDPDLVIWAIRRVLFPDLSKRLKELLQAKEGEEAFIAGYQHLKATYPDERFSEGLLNSIGYGFLLNNQAEKALIAFKLNVAEYPEDANPYDSLAEVYVKLGDNALAIQNYKRSLKLDPRNRNAENWLKKLQA